MRFYFISYQKDISIYLKKTKCVCFVYESVSWQVTQVFNQFQRLEYHSFLFIHVIHCNFWRKPEPTQAAIEIQCVYKCVFLH